MSQAQHLPMTAEDYLAWEDQQDRRWEFDGFGPVAMVGGTWAHSRIQANIITALNNRLRGKPCQPCGSDMRVRTAPDKYRYPDVTVVCIPIPPDTRDLTEPVVIFEVLSPSTAETDRTDKLGEYVLLPSLQRYILVEQGRSFATVIARSPTGWTLLPAPPGSTLAMPELGIEVPLAEFYEGVDLPPRPGTPAV